MIRAVSRFVLAIAVAVTALGVAVVVAGDWMRTSPSLEAVVALVSRSPAAQPLAATPASQRVGRATMAPLLLACAPEGATQGLDHRALYWLMQTGSRGARIGTLINPAQGAAAQLTFAKPWSDLTDCVYRQNGAALCNPDNRALAIETITTFVRLVNDAATADAAALERPEPGQYRHELQHDSDAARALKDRVLATLRLRVQEGRLVAADFDFFLPAEILDVLRRTPTREDRCARTT